MGGATVIWWVEAWDAAKHPAGRSMALPAGKKHSAPKVNSAEDAKPRVKETSAHSSTSSSLRAPQLGWMPLRGSFAGTCLCWQVGKGTRKVSGCTLRSFYESGVPLPLETLSSFLLFLLQNTDSRPRLAGPARRPRSPLAASASLLCCPIGWFLSPYTLRASPSRQWLCSARPSHLPSGLPPPPPLGLLRGATAAATLSQVAPTTMALVLSHGDCCPRSMVF